MPLRVTLILTLVLVGTPALAQTAVITGGGTAPGAPVVLLPKSGIGSGVPDPGSPIAASPPDLEASLPAPMVAPVLEPTGEAPVLLTPSPGEAPAPARSVPPQPRSDQRPEPGPRILILSGSPLQGTADRPSVLVVPRALASAGERRALSARALERGEPVLQGTVEAPRVIALAPLARDGVQLVQGGQFGGRAGAAVRPQIVELPAE